MPASDAELHSVAAQPERFATTHWSVVLAAGHNSAPNAQEALEKLCRTYWYPLYVYVRRQGHAPTEAEDLTQEFFARLLAKKYLQDVDRQKGKFRSFLLAAMNHFLSDEWDRAKRLKRGGGQKLISLDAQRAEARYALEPADEQTPEKIFERRWALALLEQLLERLAEEYLRAGKRDLFEALKNFLPTGETPPDYSTIARRLRMTAGALRMAVHRLRQRYGELFRQEIAHTVAEPQEIGEEMRYLLTVLSR